MFQLPGCAYSAKFSDQNSKEKREKAGEKALCGCQGSGVKKTTYMTRRDVLSTKNIKQQRAEAIYDAFWCHSSCKFNEKKLDDINN